MKYAIVSDIHGNLEAFEAVLTAIASERPDEIVGLGDIVGYGANPKECIDLAIQETSTCVAGNHDWGVAGETSLNYFNHVAQAAIVWTTSQLTAGHLRILAGLPLAFDRTFFIGTHATLASPRDWKYIFNVWEAEEHFQEFDQPVCFVGHSHIPVVFRRTGPSAVTCDALPTEIVLSNDSQYLINVGSVGQPRDHDPRAAFGILDTESRTFALKRTSYDISTAQKKILAAGLPPILAERLSMGW